MRHQKGVGKGRAEEKENAVRALLTKADFSIDKIADVIGVPIIFVKEVKKKLH